MASGDDQSVFTSRAADQPQETHIHLESKDDLYTKNDSPAGWGTFPSSSQPQSSILLSLCPQVTGPLSASPHQPSAVPACSSDWAFVWLQSKHKTERNPTDTARAREPQARMPRTSSGPRAAGENGGTGFPQGPLPAGGGKRPSPKAPVPRVPGAQHTMCFITPHREVR
jgi:hypothetical protein